MAGVSAADVRSALSLPTPGPSTGPSQSDIFLAATQPKERKRKPDGISRELYSLIGDSTPSLQAQFAKPRLKQKLNFGTSGSVKWEWRSFKNEARKDSLELGHWVKASSDPSAAYPFAKYNVQPNVYDYSLDEYTRFLEDPEWTKEETDYLFDLMREYDARFYVVHDRYDYPGGVPRSLEDLKDRYCSVCRKLVRNRPWPGDEISKIKLLQSFDFDKEQEVTRKKYVASLESRTPEQIAEEEALFVEIKRLEQTERRFKKDRDELLRTLLGIDSGLPDLPVDDENPVGAVSDSKNKKKKNYGSVNAAAGDIDSPSVSAGHSVISLGQPVQRKQSAKQLAQDALNCIHRMDPPATNATKSHQAAHLRSSRIPFPKPSSNAPKIIQCLQELGINHLRLIMPTRENIQQLEGVMDAASALVETKKVVDRVEQEIRVLKAQLLEKDSADAEGDGEADAEGSAVVETPTTGTPMEVDGGDAEAGSPDGRGQSVMSSVSMRGRSRKASRRSMSISSVDTSATGATSKRPRKGR
ncbi:SWR1-complex protein 4 [Punctularia strigosozonata HHB-11173 SS5]|uniref:SWR1-complex protein 4 n=1 Tax=Punctularia strigosozonata (strain HHB-11173) TaxID=741275 RepID=UPI00044166FC|nr:SWR1-complex protein 4 [Punctularia strigosozonata HHB-11173 SS5]EIN10484.1 SWR1-complex protein 4 [Punctularia strigosozonata HHB-11173 SS5]